MINLSNGFLISIQNTITKLNNLLFEEGLNRMKDENCTFCKIINREIPSKIVFENDPNLVFLDISHFQRTHDNITKKSLFYFSICS